jgi:CheY-like chemotaxis protein
MAIELLKMEETNPKRLNVLTTIESSAKRGADMVRQVLSFARGVEGQKLEVHVVLLISEIEDIIRETFLKNIHIISNLPGDLWVVDGDSTQLQQVLLNLCVNARDAMPDGGTLTISASNQILDEGFVSLNLDSKVGPYVVIQVEDSGIGMSQEVMNRIFDPFFTTKDLGKGTGLGLSTTQAIIKSHGGFIRVYSEVGHGSKFWVYLPARAETASHNAVAPPTDLPQGKGELILVVDDEEAVRQITQHTLESFGYQVLLASDGAEATALYASHLQKIAVVLTDMMMPVMDGAAMIKELMRMNPQVRIIAASGLSANGMVARAAAAGVHHFLPKPYTTTTLLEALQDILRDDKEDGRDW